jgi:hypothetical protein
MRNLRPSFSVVLGLSVSAAALLAACGSDSSTDDPVSDSGAGGGSGKGGASGASGKGGASGASAGKSGASGAGATSGASGAGGAGKGGQSGGAGAAGKGGQGGSAGAAGKGGGGQGGSTAGQGGSGPGGKGGQGGAGNAGAGNAGGQSAGGSASGAGGVGAAGSGAGGGAAGGAGAAVFDVEPAALQTISVPIHSMAPTVSYAATLGGLPVSAAWSVDRGNIGAVQAGPASTTIFAPTGTTGGLVNVIAGHSSETLQRQVMVKLSGLQNGADPSNPLEVGQIATDPGKLTEGGGIGGVGGEGLGGAVSDPLLIGALGAPVGDGQAQGLRFLYPYNQTVWPRGLLAPLLMWDWAKGDADAIQISLTTTSGSFSWSGTFSRPAVLAQTGGKFIRHPIPQDIWEMATNTAGGPTPDGTPDRLTVSLVVAQGGQAYGPISETWSVAPARLGGIIYYNSYGTRLAQNYTGAVGGNGKFGGAVLSIHAGDTGPKLTAGTDAPESGCRVCHSVAAKGSRLIVQHGDSYGTSSAYDLTPNSSTEQGLAIGTTFPAIAPDGSFALSAGGQLLPLPDDGTPLPVSGLAEVSGNLGTPAFAPDGAHVVFNPMQSGVFPNAPQKLVVMDFDQPSGAFSNPRVVADYTGQPAETRPGWPAFFPDGNSVVFQQQSVAGIDGNGSGSLATRKGAKGQIVWASAADASGLTPLNALNGLDPSGNSYLPKLPAPSALGCTADGAQVGGMDADHGDDANLNYEPTVNPIASGGYAWVVFTSRRMYGNEATIPPFCSDPRGVDLVSNITTKKLWVAAIDINAKPGQDASHPGFYLPAQELLAGNARGFWVLDPCRQDGSSCESGDQCCNGFCEASGSGGALVCSNTTPNNQCSKPQEKCASVADCCDASSLCVGGFCSQGKP